MKTTTVYFSTFYFLVIVTALFQSLSVYRRIDIGYGLTDEAFGIANSQEKNDSVNGVVSWPYADITSILFKIANEDVILFRALAALIIVGICITCIILIFVQKHSKNSTQSNLQAGVILSLSLFTIPSCFRYLLVTPSYQWIILVATSLIIIIWKSGQQSQNTFLKVSLNSVFAVLIIVISISRLSSGLAVFCILLVSYITQKNIVQNVLSLITFTVIGTLVLLNYNETLIPRILTTIEISRTIDPLGRNVFDEGLDILRPSLVLIYLVITPLLIEKATNVHRRLHNINKNLLFAAYIVGALLLYGTYFNDIQYVVFFSTGIFVGYLTRNVGLGNSRLILISLLPVTSQFGSNISASYLLAPLLISCCGYYYLVNSLNGNDSRNRQTLSKNQLANIFIVASLLAGTVQGWNNSYENGVNSEIKKEDALSNLKFSEDKYESIIRFRANVEARESFSESRVFDLSFWHPGAILYLNKKSMPYFLGNKIYSGTIAEQLELAIRGNYQYMESGRYLVLVESNLGLESTDCQELNFYVSDVRLRTAINVANFNPRMRLLGTYKSSQEDSTLFPNNLVILETCS